MKNTDVNSNIIRTVWSSVNAIDRTTLLQLNDTDLTYQIMRQVERMSTLTSEDRQRLISYIRSKVLLIRDIAESQF